MAAEICDHVALPESNGFSRSAEQKIGVQRNPAGQCVAMKRRVLSGIARRYGHAGGIIELGET